MRSDRRSDDRLELEKQHFGLVTFVIMHLIHKPESTFALAKMIQGDEIQFSVIDLSLKAAVDQYSYINSGSDFTVLLKSGGFFVFVCFGS